ncbi:MULTISPECIES: mandelate racemase/muconate lactonizing enzyme family protein [unclassified Microbacterium]|jgi:L-alanine-DL-glutamate epimerase-like enolase superfamily enzyme|uniref:mandelate racemase/muconate lactonizing enzyme family protein n=1 Tax=unclassified Microbacterium TaxID=2609290 RepID=UPI0008DA200C|nr:MULTISPECIES: mandelate racemase/muconate lactonizing enzyme family protein [unclassified Microbacterium]|tara:strand:- start:742 stop:1857 length:1116 start_codon:yes stop_codon:yes gene_type:complete
MIISRISALPARLSTDYARMSLFFVRVETTDGVVGWGESCDSFGVSYPTVLERIVDDVWGPAVIGHPLDSAPARLAAVRSATARTLGSTYASAQALSALEIAIADAAGKQHGRSAAPAPRLRDHVEVYAGNSHFLESRAASAHFELLAPLLERGVRKVKMRIGPAWRDAMRILRDLRPLLPVETDIMVDGSELFSVGEAMEMALVLADLRVSWFEEPVPSTQHAAISRIAGASPVPIAYGEHLFSTAQALDALQSSAISVIQPDASICGGLTEAHRMGTAAASRGARVVMHLHGSPVTIAANALVAGGLPGVDLIEYPFHLSPMLERVAPAAGFGIASIEDGRIAIPDSPGLGIDVDEEVLMEGHRTYVDA